jgi:hypothetical protein
MNRRITICVLAVLFSGFVPDHLTAQTTDNESSSVSTPSEQTATADVAQAQPDAEQPTVYVPTLNGTGLIAMDSTLKTHLLIGGTTSGGWDSNPNDLANGSASGVLAFSPYFGVQVNSSKAQYIFQYQPTIRRYSSSLYDGGAMNLASAQVESKLSERWRLDLKATASHGPCRQRPSAMWPELAPALPRTFLTLAPSLMRMPMWGFTTISRRET